MIEQDEIAWEFEQMEVWIRLHLHEQCDNSKPVD